MRKRKTGNYGRVVYGRAVYSEKSGPKEIKIKCFVSKMQDYARQLGLISKAYPINNHSNLSTYKICLPKWILRQKIMCKINKLARHAETTRSQCEYHFSYNLDYLILYYHYTTQERL